MELKNLDLRLVDPHPGNPRKDLGDLTVLVANIKEFGFRSAVVVRNHPNVTGRFQLEAGHRRTAAAREAGLTEIPGFVIEEDDDATAVLALLADQEAHVPYTPEERAKGWQGVLALGDLDKAARVTGESIETLRAAKRGREIVNKAKLEQASLPELAALVEFEGTEHLIDLEARIGSRDFGYYVNISREKMKKAAAMAEEEAVAERMGIKPAPIDRNVHLAIINAVDDEGPMSVEKLAELVASERLSPEDCGYYTYEWAPPYVRYFIDCEAAEAVGVRPYGQRVESDEERAEREAKEAARVSYNEGEIASREARHEHLRTALKGTFITKPIFTGVRLVLAELGDFEANINDAIELLASDTKPTGIPDRIILDAALVSAADHTAFYYIRDMQDDEAKLLATWLDALTESGYTLTPWELERLEDARAILAVESEKGGE